MIADNCPGQNKNKFMMMFLMFIVMNHISVKEIIFEFMISGHTHNSADRAFGRVSSKIYKSPLYTPLEIINRLSSPVFGKYIANVQYYEKIILWKETLKDCPAIENITRYHSFVFKKDGVMRACSEFLGEKFDTRVEHYEFNYNPVINLYAQRIFHLINAGNFAKLKSLNPTEMNEYRATINNIHGISQSAISFYEEFLRARDININGNGLANTPHLSNYYTQSKFNQQLRVDEDDEIDENDLTSTTVVLTSPNSTVRVISAPIPRTIYCAKKKNVIVIVVDDEDIEIVQPKYFLSKKKDDGELQKLSEIYLRINSGLKQHQAASNLMNQLADSAKEQRVQKTRATRNITSNPR